MTNESFWLKKHSTGRIIDSSLLRGWLKGLQRSCRVLKYNIRACDVIGKRDNQRNCIVGPRELAQIHFIFIRTNTPDDMICEKRNTMLAWKWLISSNKMQTNFYGVCTEGQSLFCPAIVSFIKRAAAMPLKLFHCILLLKIKGRWFFNDGRERRITLVIPNNNKAGLFN
jgi:hypothetical protein